MVVVGLGQEARGYQFKLEPDSKMVHVATNKVQECVLQAGDGGGGAGTGGKRLPVQAGAQQRGGAWAGGERLPVQAGARQQDGPRSN
jgi:hypothetical protein